MKNQLRFKRQGDSLVCVNEAEVSAPPTERKNKGIIFWSIIAAGIGLVILFFLDGGTGILSAGVVEAIKFTYKNVAM